MELLTFKNKAEIWVKISSFEKMILKTIPKVASTILAFWSQLLIKCKTLSKSFSSSRITFSLSF